MAILKDLAENSLLHLDDLWNNVTGLRVEDFVCRSIQNSIDADIDSINFDGSTHTLTLNRKNEGKYKNKLETKIIVAEPSYFFSVFLYAIKINGEEKIFADTEALNFLYKEDSEIFLGVALRATAQTLDLINDVPGKYLVLINYGDDRLMFGRVSSIPSSDLQLDNKGEITGLVGTPSDISNKIEWIKVNDLFKREHVASKIKIIVLDNKTAEDETFLAKTNITTQVVSLKFEGRSYITDKDTINLTITGGIGNYTLEGYNNGHPFTSDNTNYKGLVYGKNSIVVRGTYTAPSGDIIKTDYIYLDLIRTGDPQKRSAVVVNEVSNGITNNGIAKLYQIDIYNPNKIEDITIDTYLENNQALGSSYVPKNRLKYDVISPSDYNDEGIKTLEYKKYVEEDDTQDTSKYLMIKINNEWYKFYLPQFTFDSQTDAYDKIFKLMKIEAVVENYVYFKKSNIKYNFDQNTGQLNNVFITKLYDPEHANINDGLESSDGWKDNDGIISYHISAQSKPLFKAPLPLDLGNAFTIEMGFKISNISDDSKPILTIGDQMLELRANQMCWSEYSDADKSMNSAQYKEFSLRNSLFEEEKDIHLLITVEDRYSLDKNDPCYPNYIYGKTKEESLVLQLLVDDLLVGATKFTLAKIYVNGVIDREFKLNETQFKNLRKASLLINPTTADIDMYLFRVYDTHALTFEQVQKNYISYLKTKIDKEKFYKNNDILETNTKGQRVISFKKCYDKYNTLVYVYPKGGHFPNRTWGGDDKSDTNLDGANNDVDKKLSTTLFVSYADKKTNESYGGRLTDGRVKGLGSSAMRYLIWNVAYQLNKLKEKVLDPETGDEKEKKIKSRFMPYSNMDVSTNRFKKDVKVDELNDFYLMPHYDGQQELADIPITKLVGKVNYASSMQSHKVGACKLYDDAYKNAGHTLPSGGLKAVHEEPFLYFYWETENSVDSSGNKLEWGRNEINNLDLQDLFDYNNDIKFMGFQTWGSAKKDEATYGYNEDLTPEYILIEGGENSEMTANFKVPWQSLQRAEGKNKDFMTDYATPEYLLTKNPVISYVDSLKHPWENLYILDESIVHNARGAWDIDFGFYEKEVGDNVYFRFDFEKNENSVRAFRQLYDFIYKHDLHIKFVNDTSGMDSITDDSNKDETKWKAEYKYCVIGNCEIPGHTPGDLYRYDEINLRWVPAGLEYNLDTQTWSKLNVRDISGIGIENGAEMVLDGIRNIILNVGTKDEYDETGLKKVKLSDLVNVSDIAYHQAFIKFLAGTDNRAKNTYFQIIGQRKKDSGRKDEHNNIIWENDGKPDYLLRLLLDDVDTILATNNFGLLNKAYNLLEASYFPEYKEFWGDAGNAFFLMFDQVFETEIKRELGKILTYSGNDVTNPNTYLYKVLFDVLDYFPAIAFNYTSKLYYEAAQFLKDFCSGKNQPLSYFKSNDTDPISLSHGACSSCEKQFLSKRYDLLASYALVHLGSPMALTDGGNSGNKLNFWIKYTPYLDFYPIYNADNTYYVNSGKGTNSKYDTIKYLAKTGQVYDNFVNTISSGTNTRLYLTNLFKTFEVLGLLQNPFSSQSVNFDKTVDFKIDNNDLSDHPFGSETKKFEMASFVPSLAVIERLTLRNMGLPKTIDLSKSLKLNTIDFTDSTNLEHVVFPKTGHLTTLKLPNTLVQFDIYDNPNLSTILIDGYDNLQRVFIDGSRCGKFDLDHFCEQIVRSPLTNVTLTHVNLNITEDVLINLMRLGNDLKITGTINIVDSLTTKALKDINFDTKRKLVKIFGNFESLSSKLKINYLVSDIYSFNYNAEVSIYRKKSEIGAVVKDNKFNVSVSTGNDIEIIEDEYGARLDIAYTFKDSVDPRKVKIDPVSGNITLIDESQYSKLGVTISMKVKNNPVRLTAQSTVRLQWEAPKIGDFAYADGDFSSAYNPNKTLVGIVYAKLSTSENATTGDVYILGCDYVADKVNTDGYYIGYDSIPCTGLEQNELRTLYLVTSYLKSLLGESAGSYDKANKYATVDVTSLSDHNPVPDLELGVTSLTYKVIDNSTLINGANDTLKYVEHVNTLLLNRILDNPIVKPYIKHSSGKDPACIENLDKLENLSKAMTKLYPNLNGQDALTCLLYPYFYSMYLYEPTVKEGEILDDLYKAGHWYAPSISEWQRVIYYRGYSAKGESFFNTADLVDDTIKLVSGPISKDPLKIPIFSMALERMTLFPSAWLNLTAGKTGAEYTNITTSAANNGNYVYLVLTTYGSNSYLDKYTWFTGAFPSNSMPSDSLKKKAWRFSKHKGLPFTKYTYVKENE